MFGVGVPVCVGAGVCVGVGAILGVGTRSSQAPMPRAARKIASASDGSGIEIQAQSHSEDEITP